MDSPFTVYEEMPTFAIVNNNKEVADGSVMHQKA